MSWAQTIKGPDCNKPHTKLPRSNYIFFLTICFPSKLKQTLKQGTNNLPKFIFQHAHWVSAIWCWNGRGRKCLFIASATQLCALRHYSQLMSDRVVTTQYSKHMWMTTKHTKTWLLVKKEHYIKFDLLSSDTTPPSSWIFSLYITYRTCSSCQIRLNNFFWSVMVIVYLVNDAIIHSFTGAKVFRTSDVPSNLFNRFTNVSCQQLNLNVN